MNNKQIANLIDRQKKIVSAQGLPSHAIVAIMEAAALTGNVAKFKGAVALAIGGRGLEVVEAAVAMTDRERMMPLSIEKEMYIDIARNTIREHAMAELSERMNDAMLYVAKKPESLEDEELKDVFSSNKSDEANEPEDRPAIKI